MGTQDVRDSADGTALRAFMRALLDDIHALERMIEGGLIETGVRRIGAEQELYLVDERMRPSPIAPQLLENLGGGGAYAPELGTFNIEANLAPQGLAGDGLRRLEAELTARLAEVRAAARAHGGRAALVGILPTLGKEHLTLDYMTKSPRYAEINRVISEIRGGTYQTYIKGLDELEVVHDNMMFEACTTSFQVHFQVEPDEFARLYNLAQAVTAPVLAAAVNSPFLMNRRLWQETRVAVFQQSLDARSEAHRARGGRQRVSFGESWVEESVMELFREDVARNRVLLGTDLGEPSQELLDRGELPPLRALCLHNGTVYRWNRPCYGVGGGKAHLRIENRALPAGPTVIDEMANAAFYFGLMSGLGDEVGDIAKDLSFDHAKDNFMAAARYGLKAQFHWLGNRAVTAAELVADELVPCARRGLESVGVQSEDVARYLDVIEARVRSGRTGSQWALDSLSAMGEEANTATRFRALTAAMVSRQEDGEPVHTWTLAEAGDELDWREHFRTVGQFMTTDLFTVQPEDLVDLAASVMEWEHLRHVPVEDKEGALVGLLSHRALMRLVGRGSSGREEQAVAVRDIMKPDPVTVTPETTSLEAMGVMRENKVGCLPVVSGGKLVGIVTEHDFIEVARKLLERELKRS